MTPGCRRDYDLVLRGGRVIDPESKLDGVRDVGIAGGRVAAVSQQELKGRKVIDARGMIVAPGFIDLHSHALELPGQRMQACDGVTTALELESGLLPVAAAYDMFAARGAAINYGFGAAWTFARIAAMIPQMPPPQPTAEWYQSAFSHPRWTTDTITADELEKAVCTAYREWERHKLFRIFRKKKYFTKALRSPRRGLRHLFFIYRSYRRN